MACSGGSSPPFDKGLMTVIAKRLCLGVLVLAILNTLVGPLATLAQAPLTKVYTSADGAFSFNYPGGWMVVPNGGMDFLASSEEAMTAFDSGFAPGSRQALALIFEPYTLESSLSLTGESEASLTDQLAMLLQSMEMPFDVSTAEERTLGGKQAAVVTISNEVFDGLLVLSDLGGATFALLGFMSPGVRAEFEPLLLAVAESAAWDATQSSLVDTLAGHIGPVLDIAFSADGQRLTSLGGYEDSTLRQWNMANDELLSNMYIDFGDTGDRAVMAPNGMMIASFRGWRNGAVTLWDATSGQYVRTLTSPGNNIGGAAFDGASLRLAAAGCVTYDENDICRPDSAYVAVWDVQSGVLLYTLPTRLSEGAMLTRLAFSPDGQLLAAGGCSGWSPSTGGCGGGRLLVWDMNSGQSVVDQDMAPISALDIGPDNHTVAVGACEYERVNCVTPYVSLVDIMTGSVIGTLSTENMQEITKVAFDPANGNLLATATEGDIITVWNVATDEPLKSLVGHRDYINRLRFRPDGTVLASASDDGTIKLWAVPAGEDTRVLFEREYTLHVVHTSATSGITSSTGEDVQVTIRVSGPNVIVLGEPAVLTVEILAPNYDRANKEESWEISQAQIAVVLPDDTAELTSLPEQSLLVNTGGQLAWQTALRPSEFESVWLPTGIYVLWQAIKIGIGFVPGAAGLDAVQDTIDTIEKAGDVVIDVTDAAAALSDRRPLSDEELWAYYQFENAYDIFDLPDYEKSGVVQGEQTAKRYEISVKLSAYEDMLIYVNGLQVRNATANAMAAQDFAVHAEFDQRVIIPLPLSQVYR